jgi:hypothetical protein
MKGINSLTSVPGKLNIIHKVLVNKCLYKRVFI